MEAFVDLREEVFLDVVVLEVKQGARSPKVAGRARRSRVGPSPEVSEMPRGYEQHQVLSSRLLRVSLDSAPSSAMSPGQP